MWDTLFGSTSQRTFWSASPSHTNFTLRQKMTLIYVAFCRFGLLEAVYLLSTVTIALSFVSPVSSSEIVFNLPPRKKAEVLSIDTSALSKQTLDPVMYHRYGCQFRQIKEWMLDWKLRATSKSQFMYVKTCLYIPVQANLCCFQD